MMGLIAAAFTLIIVEGILLAVMLNQMQAMTVQIHSNANRLNAANDLLERTVAAHNSLAHEMNSFSNDYARTKQAVERMQFQSYQRSNSETIKRINERKAADDQG